MNIIDMKEWDITYTELVKWATDTGADVYGVATYGANISPTKYSFANPEDLTAFKLYFQKRTI